MNHRWTGAFSVAVAMAIGCGTFANAASVTGTYAPGASGSAVRLLQTELDELGYHIPVTGYFGSITEAAVANFESAHRLPVNGVVNATVEAALTSALEETAHHTVRAADTAKPSGVVRYRIQAGETLDSIAAAFHTTVATLVELNHLSTPNLLHVGQWLWVPDGSAASAGATPKPSVTRYRVQPGDTIDSIAAKFHVSWTALITANHLADPNDLKVGEVLVIPGAVPSDKVTAKTASANLPMASTRTTLGEAIVATALKYLGVPYVWGAENPAVGFDCSGLVQYVLAQNGISIGRTTWDQYQEVTPVPRSDLQPGDLVFFTTYAPGASHVGIYMGPDPSLGYSQAFIDAPEPGQSVMIQNLDSPFWIQHYYGAGAVTP
ncbi:MAG: LysM peptidoglycan-binding domain-containing protein [Firmicutes bacterium]|nr:LysM peptidoglycan-binding domain-containing protein [Bacillota bacterium]